MRFYHNKNKMTNVLTLATGAALITGSLWYLFGRRNGYKYEPEAPSFSNTRMQDKLTPVMSRIDGRVYAVNSTFSNQQEAADLLATVHERIMMFVSSLSRKMPHYIPDKFRRGVQLLLDRTQNGLVLNELDSTKSDVLAFNKNKGEQIYLCIRAQNHSPVLASPESVLYIAIHEVAHLMQDLYEPLVNGSTVHGEAFKNNERFLMESARKYIGFDYEFVPGSLVCNKELPSL